MLHCIFALNSPNSLLYSVVMILVQSLKRALEKSYRNIITHHYVFRAKLHLQITAGKQNHLCSRRRELLDDTDDKILATVSMTLSLKILLWPPQSFKRKLIVILSLAPLRLDLDSVCSYQKLVQINFVQYVHFARKNKSAAAEMVFSEMVLCFYL